MKNVMRKLLGTIAGLAAAVAVIALAQMISGSLYPIPADVKAGGRDAIKLWINDLPLGAFLILFASYAVASMTGGFVSTLASKSYPAPAVIVSGILTVLGILTQISIPQPVWQSALIILCFLPMTLYGARLATGNRFYA